MNALGDFGRRFEALELGRRDDRGPRHRTYRAPQSVLESRRSTRRPKRARRPALAAPHIRRPGAGRKSIKHHDPDLVAALEALVEPTRGDPESPLRWTCKSTRRLATR